MLLLVLFLARLTTTPRPSFARDVRPLLEQRCAPCHFAGGKMYGHLPFDKPQTLKQLGEKKLFTRIRDARERAVIHDFLAGYDGVSPGRGSPAK